MSKGNPNHDPHTGEFSSGGGGSSRVKIGKFGGDSGHDPFEHRHVKIAKLSPSHPAHKPKKGGGGGIIGIGGGAG